MVINLNQVNQVVINVIQVVIHLNQVVINIFQVLINLNQVVIHLKSSGN